MKRLMLCDEHECYIDEEDVENLKRVSPGLARLVRDADHQAATHFVCGQCGQISPLRLRDLHDCRTHEGRKLTTGG